MDLSVYISFLMIRKREEIHTSHYQAKGFPWMAYGMILITCGLIIGLVKEDFINSMYAGIIVLVGVGVYGRMIRNEKLPQ